MAVAKLKIEVEGGADIRRMLGDIGTQTRRANQALVQDQQRSASQTQRVADQSARERIRAERSVSQAQQAASRQRAAGEREEARDADRAEREKTSVAKREAQERVRTAQDEQRQADRALRAGVRAHRDSERQKTRDAQREARARASLGQVAGAVGGAARTFVSNVNSAIQSPRAQRARLDRRLDDTFAQITSSGDEWRGLRQQVHNYAANRTQSLGMTSEDIEAGIGSAQTQFNVLGQGENTAAQRTTNLSNVMTALHLGALTGQDPQEVGRIYGLMRHGGMTHEQAMPVLQNLTAIGFSGSLPLSTISSAMLPSMMNHIATRQSEAHTTDPATLQRIMGEAMVEHFVNAQIEASAGVPAGRGGNALEAMARQINNPGRATMLHNRLMEQFSGHGQEAERARIASMFHGTGNGNFELTGANRGALGFMGSIGGLFHDDPQRVANFMSAHGSWSDISGGRNQVLTDPVTRMFTGMFARDATTGKTGYQSAIDLSQSNLTPTYLAGLQHAREGEDLTEINANDEERTNALRDSNSSMVRMSDALTNFEARNPVLGALVGSMGGLAAALGSHPMVGGGPGGVLPTLMGSTLGTALPKLLGGGALSALALPLAIGGLMGSQMTSPGSGEDALGIGGEEGAAHRDAVRRQMDATRGGHSTNLLTGMRPVAEAEGQLASAQVLFPALREAAHGNATELAAMIARLPRDIQTAMATLHLVAAVSPQDAAHADSQARSHGSGTGHT